MLDTLFRKPTRILIYLKKSMGESISDIRKKTGITYAYLVKSVRRFENEGLVRVEEHGRKKIVSLTEKGKEISNHFCALEELLKTKEV